MPLLTEQELRTAARRTVANLNKSAPVILREHVETSATKFDIFLSHSIKDAEIVLGARSVLRKRFKLSVYVDWIVDPQMKRGDVTPATAAVLRRRMKQCKALFYLKTVNSVDSTWMPWELGYFDALRSRVAILPVVKDVQDEYDGNEYLGLYPYVDVTPNKENETTMWVTRSPKKYARFVDWLDGAKIPKRS